MDEAEEASHLEEGIIKSEKESIEIEMPAVVHVVGTTHNEKGVENQAEVIETETFPASVPFADATVHDARPEREEEIYKKTTVWDRIVNAAVPITIVDSEKETNEMEPILLAQIVKAPVNDEVEDAEAQRQDRSEAANPSNCLYCWTYMANDWIFYSILGIQACWIIVVGFWANKVYESRCPQDDSAWKLFMTFLASAGLSYQVTKFCLPSILGNVPANRPTPYSEDERSRQETLVNMGMTAIIGTILCFVYRKVQLECWDALWVDSTQSPSETPSEAPSETITQVTTLVTLFFPHMEF